MSDEKVIVITKNPPWTHRATFRQAQHWDKYLNVEHPFEPNGLKPVEDEKESTKSNLTTS